jgi:hypothetical protein
MNFTHLIFVGIPTTKKKFAKLLITPTTKRRNTTHHSSRDPDSGRTGTCCELRACDIVNIIAQARASGARPKYPTVHTTQASER